VWVTVMEKERVKEKATEMVKVMETAKAAARATA
jgi:hypothetical protein